MHGSNSTQREHTGIPVNNQQHFFFKECFFHVDWLLGRGRSEESQWSHCVTLVSLLESERSTSSPVPTTDVVTALKKREISALSSAEVWNSAAECGSVFGPRDPEHVLIQLTRLLKCVQPFATPPTTNTSALLWKSLGNFLLSWCSHTGFEVFCSRKGSQKKHSIFYLFFTLKITCFLKNQFRFYFNTLNYYILILLRMKL